MIDALMVLAPRGQAGDSRIGTGGLQTSIAGLEDIPIPALSALSMTVIRSFAVFALAVFFAATMAPGELRAQDREVPYWASMRFDEVNMRVGPSREYPIEWVYKRKGMPLKVVRLREGWRLVQDHEGTQGWVAESQLSLSRGALIIGDGPVEMRGAPAASSPLRWRAEPGVVGELMRCRENFCEIDVAGRSGWVAEDRVWGAGDMKPAP